MEYVYIGKIVNTHGIKGEIRIISNFLRKELVFKNKMPIYIGENHTKEIINTYRKHKNFDMVTLYNYSNINEVLKYMKMNVYVNRVDLNLDKDDYLLDDLIGFEIIEDNKNLGKVKEIVYNNGSILLQIEGENNFYIPNVSEYIKKVNLEDKIIEVQNTKGLIL